mmetsp:Transcript_4947/g.14425  ORF Transcript_4947/g.14425 Transcript_4947/m.14425 type:complete len:213 (+) Transcript_4947:265-903(+)
MVMLSPPMPYVRLGSGERHASRRCSMTLDILMVPLSRSWSLGRMKSTTCWLVKTSQMPSQAMIMNSSSGWRWKIRMSGVAQTICCSGASFEFCLNLKSPIDRDKLRSPFTRWRTCGPKRWFMTHPPAFSMRACSPGKLGLWSSDMSTAMPWRQRTARLSPALATTMVSGQTQHTTAVQPIRHGSTVRTAGGCLESDRKRGWLLGSMSISSMQ